MEEEKEEGQPGSYQLNDGSVPSVTLDSLQNNVQEDQETKDS